MCRWSESINYVQVSKSNIVLWLTLLLSQWYVNDWCCLSCTHIALTDGIWLYSVCDVNERHANTLSYSLINSNLKSWLMSWRICSLMDLGQYMLYACLAITDSWFNYCTRSANNWHQPVLFYSVLSYFYSILTYFYPILSCAFLSCFYSILSCSVPFCFILFCSILCYPILFYAILIYSNIPMLCYSILFYSIYSNIPMLIYCILFCSVLCYSTLFLPVPFWFILCYSILSNPILYHSILFHSVLLYSILFCSVLSYFILFCSILRNSILSFSVLFYSILFWHTYANLFYPLLFCLFYSILFLPVPSWFILCYSILSNPILCHSMLFHSVLFCSILSYSVLYYPNLFNSILLYSILLCMQEIQSLLINWKGPDLTTYGELVLEGTFHVHRAKNERTLFLFDKMLLITKKTRGTLRLQDSHLGNRMLFILRQHLLFRPGIPKPFHHPKHFDVRYSLEVPLRFKVNISMM